MVEPTPCGHFETQADAQAALDAGNVANPEHLDADRDGIACEFRFGEVEPEPDGGQPTEDRVVALPDTGTGSTAALPGYDAALMAMLGIILGIAGARVRRRGAT